MIDGYGARVSLSAISFISWVFVINALLHTFVMRLKDEKNIIQRLAKYGKKIFIFGGSLDYFTYITVVWAFTKAPIPIVGILIVLVIFEPKLSGTPSITTSEAPFFFSFLRQS